MLLSDRNVATVRRFWAAINDRDVDSYLDTFADHALAFDPADKPPLKTSEERRQFMAGLLGGFSQIDARLDFVTPCGSSTAVKWTVDGRSTSGNPIRIEGIDVYDHAPDGRIREMRGYFQM